MKVGYARTSTAEGQDVENQLMRLREAGCEKLFWDAGVSGTKGSRPYWDRCLAFMRSGDVLVSTKLDRWGRSTQHLLEVAAGLEARGIGLKCLDQGVIDTTTPTGKLLFTILSAVAEFERSLIVSRTMDGLAAARAKGHMGGRPKSYTGQQCQVARMLRDQGEMTAPEIADLLGVSRATYFRMVAAEPVSA
jgi:DNA invertase Pin-like site-specific DNA recombinase